MILNYMQINGIPNKNPKIPNKLHIKKNKEKSLSAFKLYELAILAIVAKLPKAIISGMHKIPAKKKIGVLL